MHTRIKRTILELARANPTQEVCGFVYVDALGQAQVLPCANISPEPDQAFDIDVQDHIRALHIGPMLLGVYHSHPGQPGGFSSGDPSRPDEIGDLEYINELNLPAWLCNTEDGSWHHYVPPGYEIPLEGRAWCLGFQDCWETPRIYYRQKHRIYMDDYERDESFCHEEQGTILANYEREGFVQLAADPSLIRLHDILLFHTDKLLPQHFGVFVGNSRMLHHRMGELSKVELLTESWVRRLVGVFRHRSLV